MKMHDVSYEYDSAMCSPDSKDAKKRKEYPGLYIRGKAIPKLEVGEDGMGTATIKFRILGYREPTEGEKTLELEIHEIGGVGATMEDTDTGDDDEKDGLDEAFDKVAKEYNDKE